MIEFTEDAELFYSAEQDCFATVKINDHYETYRIASNPFKNWLRHRYYMATSKGVGAQALADAVGAIEAKALFDGKKYEVGLRVMDHEREIYIDLGLADWSYVRVNSEGWTFGTDKPPVKFHRSKTMKPLPIPDPESKGSDIHLLKRFLNVEVDDDAEKLIFSFLISTFNPRGPYPVLVTYGEQGSSKSTLTRVLRELTDPSTVPIRTLPKKTEDLLISAKNNRTLAFDNVSYLSDDMSNDLACIATGTGIARRTLYTDGDETVITAMNPIILNGIEEFVARGDLADRSIFVSLPSIPGGKRKREEIFWAEFNEVKRRIFGALLCGVSEALANKDQFTLKKQPRMADAWHFISAAETAFGFERGKCLMAFESNQGKAAEVLLASSPLYPHIQNLADQPMGWTGTPSKLLEVINSRLDGVSHFERRFLPQTARGLTDKLRLLAPALKKVAIEVSFEKTSGSNSKRIVSIKKVESSYDANDASAPPSDEGDASDGKKLKSSCETQLGIEIFV